MRETRDLLRRRNRLVRKRAQLIAHIQIVNAQYNLPPFPKEAHLRQKPRRDASRPALPRRAGPQEHRGQQFQVEIPRRPIHRQFNIHVGQCQQCHLRVQGRHPLQTSDALGAARPSTSSVNSYAACRCPWPCHRDPPRPNLRCSPGPFAIACPHDTMRNAHTATLRGQRVTWR
jgi:hypothetical protein